MTWRSREVLAWTEGDGPGRPPAGPSYWLSGSLAVTLTVAHVGMLFSDTLCPDHRSWVLGLGTVAVLAAGFAIVGLLKSSSASIWLTVAAAVSGVLIGVIDAVHEPTRGRVLVLLFGVVALFGVMLGAWQVRLRRWERRTVVALAPLPPSEVETLKRPAVRNESAPLPSEPSAEQPSRLT